MFDVCHLTKQLVVWVGACLSYFCYTVTKMTAELWTQHKRWPQNITAHTPMVTTYAQPLHPWLSSGLLTRGREVSTKPDTTNTRVHFT